MTKAGLAALALAFCCMLQLASALPQGRRLLEQEADTGAEDETSAEDSAVQQYTKLQQAATTAVRQAVPGIDALSPLAEAAADSLPAGAPAPNDADSFTKLDLAVTNTARKALKPVTDAMAPIASGAETATKALRNGADPLMGDVASMESEAPAADAPEAESDTVPFKKEHELIHKILHKAAIGAAPAAAPEIDAAADLADQLAPAMDTPITELEDAFAPAAESATLPFKKEHKLIHKILHKAAIGAAPAAAPEIDAAADLADQLAPAMDTPITALEDAFAPAAESATLPFKKEHKLIHKILHKALVSAVPAAAPALDIAETIVGTKSEMDDGSEDLAPSSGNSIIPGLPADISATLANLLPSNDLPAMGPAIEALGRGSLPSQATSAVQRAYMDALIDEARAYERAYQSARKAAGLTVEDEEDMAAPAPAPSSLPMVDSAEPAQGAPSVDDKHDASPEYEAKPCMDVAPTEEYSCQEQASWNKCSESFMEGYCAKSCNRC